MTSWPEPEPEGPVLVFDDDHYYMGSVIAERLRRFGREVILVTPEPVVSAYTEFTLEQTRVQRGLIESGVQLVVAHTMSEIRPGRSDPQLRVHRRGPRRRLRVGSASHRDDSKRPVVLRVHRVPRVHQCGHWT